MLEIEEKFIANQTNEGLLEGCTNIGVAVSGGSDSVALIHLLQLYSIKHPIKLFVLCFDHAIEGENSLAETEFVRKIAKDLNIDTYIERADPPVAPSAGLSMEMAARIARRAFFIRAAKACSLDAIATGHQQNDIAETLMIRLLRGAGSTGLSGLRPSSYLKDNAGNKIKIIRPLLPFSRESLRDYLRTRSITWMDDVSNFNDEITRNRIRLRTIPYLAQKMGKDEEVVTNSLAQSAQILRDEDNLLESLAAELLKSNIIDSKLNIAAVRAAPKALARRAIRMWLIDNSIVEGSGFDYVERILSPLIDSVNLPHDMSVVIKDSLATIKSQKREKHPLIAPALLPYGKTTKWLNYELTVSASKEIIRSRPKLNSFPAECTLNKKVLEQPITVRTRKAGDFMEPFGIDGHQSVQDIFINGKLPEEIRDEYPLVFVGDELAWIPGYRISRKFAAEENSETVKITIAKCKAFGDGES